MKVINEGGIDKIRQIVKLIVDKFLAADLLTRDEIQRQNLLNDKQQVTIKLHCTVANSKQRIQNQPSSNHKHSTHDERIPFDATDIINTWGDYDFGKHKIEHQFRSCFYL